MDDVFQFAASFKEYPPWSTRPSFVPTDLLEQTLREIRVEKKVKEAFPMLLKETEPQK